MGVSRPAHKRKDIHTAGSDSPRCQVCQSGNSAHLDIADLAEPKKKEKKGSTHAEKDRPLTPSASAVSGHGHRNRGHTLGEMERGLILEHFWGQKDPTEERKRHIRGTNAARARVKNRRKKRHPGANRGPAIPKKGKSSTISN